MSEAKIPPRPTGPHPTAEQLYLAVAAERSGACSPEDEEIFAHAASCADCSAEIAHLEAFAQPEPVAPAAIDAAWQRFRHRADADAGRAPAGPPPRQATIVPFPSRPVARLSPWRYTGWAAAAMLVVGLGLGFFLGTSNVMSIASTPAASGTPVVSHPPVAPTAGPAPTIPAGPGSSEAPDGLRGGPAETAGEVAPTGRLDRAPTEIRFANPGHDPKRVLLFATDPPYQWQSPETTAERIELPAAERAKLKPGVDYFWSVLDAEGESAAQTFRLRRR
ncbi:MAG TPA: hypothetical protein VGS22_23700 [Thermoanaerobaculia bacterium]|jgi:hypothetical protein|nr:hypothetical protein [Thermoanaerobaculia bacterium]